LSARQAMPRTGASAGRGLPRTRWADTPRSRASKSAPPVERPQLWRPPLRRAGFGLTGFLSRILAPQDSVEPADSIGVEGRHHMAIGVHGRRYSAVPEHVLDNLGMDALDEQSGRRGVGRSWTQIGGRCPSYSARLRPAPTTDWCSGPPLLLVKTRPSPLPGCARRCSRRMSSANRVTSTVRMLVAVFGARNMNPFPGSWWRARRMTTRPLTSSEACASSRRLGLNGLW
jgi:hypothetical protein